MSQVRILFICISNHMFRKAIWNKLPERIFENFEIARMKKGQFQNCSNRTGGYWLITPNQQTLCIKTNIF